MEDVEGDVPQPTIEESKSIRAISKDNVHKICSGQVVLSLAVAVKELVENSLDAGASQVEIKLVQQGLESIEVSDNGTGVEVKNLEGMTAKYHTSKLRDFVDLQSVETFGFRGEALSSLCALADISIITRHQQTDVATKIFLDRSGKIKSRQQIARGIGTTVVLTNLFEALPVRRREFVKNVKKEFNKMCQILHAYCLVAKGVRIICTNHTAKGHKTVVMQTHGSADVLANISAVFGNSQTSGILTLCNPLDETNCKGKDDDTLLAEIQKEIGASQQLTQDDYSQLKEYGLQLEGLISSCSHGSGRSSKDRQFFYVNSRPCDPKNISKAVNDTYHRYNAAQFPFVYLNIITDRKSVDVNLTPDKRHLLLNNENVLVAVIKSSLVATFNMIPSTFKMQNTLLTAKTESKLNSDQTEDYEHDVPEMSQDRFVDVLSQWKRTGSTEGNIPRASPYKRKCVDDISIRTLKMKKIQEYLQVDSTTSDKCSEAEKNEHTLNEPISNACDSNTLDNCSQLETHMTNVPTDDVAIFQNNPSFEEAKAEIEDLLRTVGHEVDPSQPTVQLDDTEPAEDLPKMKCNELRTSISEIELMLKAEDNLLNDKRKQFKIDCLRFKCEINPNKNQTAEAELQKEISKAHFQEMQVLGQFNLGFIITKLDSDLFIVDQHATDEKYNFETLQKTTQLQHQPLAVAQPLELTAVNEMVLIDHLPVFEKNGFRLEINENGTPTKKVRLLGKPYSKNWEFGKEDIDELIFMLQDASEGTMCRPSRITSMFASRACRMSVMIGKALKQSSMETLIRHMGEIEQPWNCPHGRPTMRHLINIAMLLDTKDEEHEDEKV